VRQAMSRQARAIGVACLALIAAAADARLTHLVIETRERVAAARAEQPPGEVMSPRRRGRGPPALRHDD